MSGGNTGGENLRYGIGMQACGRGEGRAQMKKRPSCPFGAIARERNNH